MKHAIRNPITGRFEKRQFELYLHDFGNLSVQLVDVSEDKTSLENVAERLNNVFLQSGRGEQFKAEVYEQDSQVSN